MSAIHIYNDSRIYHSVLHLFVHGSVYRTHKLFPKQNQKEDTWERLHYRVSSLWNGCFSILLMNHLLTKHNLNKPIIQFLVFAFVMTLFEYCVGIYVGAGADSYIDGAVSSWDYSKERYNYKGIITLRHFISWGILGLVLLKINPYIMKVVKCGINCDK